MARAGGTLSCEVCGTHYQPGHQNKSRSHICRRCRGPVKRVREWLRRELGKAPSWQRILRQAKQEGVGHTHQRARRPAGRR